MRKGIRTASLLLIVALPAAAHAAGSEPDADMRAAAKTLVTVEQSLARNDLNGYCTAVMGAPDYPAYVERACQAAVRNNVRKAEDCTADGIRQEVRMDRDRCLAMSADNFEKAKLGWPGVLERFSANLVAKGVDAGTLLQDERAKLR